MIFEFSEEELEYLILATKFRVEDETKEVNDLLSCHRDEWVPAAQHRVDIWKRILMELMRGKYAEGEGSGNDSFR